MADEPAHASLDPGVRPRLPRGARLAHNEAQGGWVLLAPERVFKNASAHRSAKGWTLVEPATMSSVPAAPREQDDGKAAAAKRARADSAVHPLGIMGVRSPTCLYQTVPGKSNARGVTPARPPPRRPPRAP